MARSPGCPDTRTCQTVADDSDRDRYLGALVGLCGRRCSGAPLEFTQRDAAPAVTGMRGGGNSTSSRVNGLTTRRWPCIASSLIETGTFDLRDQPRPIPSLARRGVPHQQGKCFRIGQQTFWALSDFTKSGTVTRNSSRRWRAGNGSLMRLAPVPMVFAHDLDLAALRFGRKFADDSSRHAECREACATYGRLIAGALRGWGTRRNPR